MYLLNCIHLLNELHEGTIIIQTTYFSYPRACCMHILSIRDLLVFLVTVNVYSVFFPSLYNNYHVELTSCDIHVQHESESGTTLCMGVIITHYKGVLTMN